MRCAVPALSSRRRRLRRKRARPVEGIYRGAEGDEQGGLERARRVTTPFSEITALRDRIGGRCLPVY